jgi:hypothetical protein
MRANIQGHYTSIDDDHQWELSDSVLDAWLVAGVIASYQTHTITAGYGPNQQRAPRAHRDLRRSMEMDVKAGKAPRCSLVINKKLGMPGAEYFEVARSLGFNIPYTLNDERAFWESQIRLLGLDPTALRLV